MKINRMADEKMAPGWLFEGKDAMEFSDSTYITSDELDRIISMQESLSDDDVILERELIEASVDRGSIYHVSSKWNEKTKSSLKEYAIVCGMDMSKFRVIDPDKIIEANEGLGRDVESDYSVYFRKRLDEKLSSKGLSELHQLSSEDQKEIFKDVDKEWKSKNEVVSMHDPFQLDKLGDMSHMEKAKWEDNKKQADLKFKPTMDGSVVPIRGGEDYFKNSNIDTARGQNSIMDPDAIKTYADNEEEDTGARLHRENKERAKQREVNHKEWQDEKVASMKGSEILPHGKVFPTEAMNAQPGIRGDVFGLDSVPEKTAGEKLAEANENRRKKIQGQDKEEYEFKPEKASVRGISDTFANELKKFVK